MILGAIRDSVNAGLFDHQKSRHLSVVTYQLDRRGWKEIGELYDATLDRTMEIAAESAGRLSKSKAKGKDLRATFIQLAFESPPGSPGRHELGAKRGSEKDA